MPQSLSNVLVHIIFSTKDRAPLLAGHRRQTMHAYLAGVVHQMKGECYRVGGTDDHVHLAVRLHRTTSVSSLVEQLKTDSSKWMKADGVSTFSWQRGYAALSFGSSALRSIVEYVEGQTEHHRRWCFQDELRALLAEEGVEFDDRYLWD